MCLCMCSGVTSPIFLGGPSGKNYCYMAFKYITLVCSRPEKCFSEFPYFFIKKKCPDLNAFSVNSSDTRPRAVNLPTYIVLSIFQHFGCKL